MEPVDHAAELIRSGGVVAYPTEAVFGLGCDPMDEQAVLRILALKERSVFEGVILIAASIRQLEPFIHPLTESMRELVFPTWPGPHTWIVPARADCPAWIRGRHETIAVRVTAHPLAAELCARAGCAVVSTSANLHGAPPARSADEVEGYFGARVDFILPGETGGLERPTAIRDAVSGTVMRRA